MAGVTVVTIPDQAHEQWHQAMSFEVKENGALEVHNAGGRTIAAYSSVGWLQAYMTEEARE